MGRIGQSTWKCGFLAYSFDIALQNEFSLEENIALARQLLLENFVSRVGVALAPICRPVRWDG